MKATDLKERTIEFSAKIMDFVESLPESKSIRVISDQVLRSSSSIGANYRAAGRSKSLKDFINKLKIVEEEADETLYWLELLERRKVGSSEMLKPLIKEANELVSIFVASINTAKSNLALQNIKNSSKF
jgi:four helix bundle protein